MSACLSGGAAAYSFELEKVKSPPSSSTTTTRATSPSSTLSESSNSPLVISTRKPRTARKRPNQTYNEAAALLSTAYPNLFFSSSSSSSNTKKKSQFYKTAKSPLLSDNDEASDLLLESIEEPDFLFHPTIQTKSHLYLEHKEVNSGDGGRDIYDYDSKFDFSDELDEEIEEGIDSIMANFESNSSDDKKNLGIVESRVPGINRIGRLEQLMMMKNRFNYPLGLGLRSGLRQNDDASWCTFHTVDFEQISPRIPTVEKSKKKKKKKTKKVAPATESTVERLGGGSMLKLDYDGVLEAWSHKASPFSDEILGSEATGADVNVCNTNL